MSCEHCQHCRELAVERQAWREWLQTTDSVSESERAVLKAAYRRRPIDLDELAEHTGIMAAVLATARTDLQRRGLIEPKPNGRLRIVFRRFNVPAATVAA